jgi:hypothetical protein
MKLLRALLESDVHKIFENWVDTVRNTFGVFEVFENPTMDDFKSLRKYNDDDEREEVRFIINYQRSKLYIFNIICFHKDIAEKLNLRYDDEYGINIENLYGTARVQFPNKLRLIDCTVLKQIKDLPLNTGNKLGKELIELVKSGKLNYLKYWFGESFNKFILKQFQLLKIEDTLDEMVTMHVPTLGIGGVSKPMAQTTSKSSPAAPQPSKPSTSVLTTSPVSPVGRSLDPNKYYARFNGRLIGPFNSESAAKEITGGKAEWVKKGNRVVSKYV